MPTLGRLRRESTVFTRAYAPAPWTLPSRLSAITGLPAHELGVSFDSQVYDHANPTLAERFRRRGYRTAAVISNSFLNVGTGVARGFDTFQQAQAALDVCRTAPGLMADTYWPWFSAAVCNWTASEVTRRGRALMDDSTGPFFLMLNYMDAHDPYYVEPSCGEPRGYRAAIRCLDRNLAPIVDWRSARSPTVLAIVGDHGEQFGEHGLQRHGNSLYVQLLHVPLIVRSGNGADARQHTVPISIAALPSLIDDENRTSIDAGPVLGVLHPPAASNLPSEWSALDGAWHLIVRERGPAALYHLSTDPAETRNLISEGASDPAIARLRASIEQMQRSPRPDLRRFRSLGYLQ
jgi:arylsulfatase A-like enzyme